MVINSMRCKVKAWESISSIRYFQILTLQLYHGVHAIHFCYHRLLSKRFPYAIYYLLENNEVQIYAVLDCRQNPQTIHDHLIGIEVRDSD